MEIAEWLEENQMSLLALAKKAKVSQATLYAAFSRRSGLSERIAKKISRATKGTVSVEDAMSPPRYQFEDARKKLRKVVCKYCGK